MAAAGQGWREALIGHGMSLIGAPCPAQAADRAGTGLAPAGRAGGQRLVAICVAPHSAGPAEFDAMMQADRACSVPFIRAPGITLES
jgi:hypothetical protein